MDTLIPWPPCGFSLVLANADQAVTKYMTDKYSKSKSSSIGGSRHVNGEAYNKGRAAGQSASINTPIGGGSRGMIGN